MTAVRLNWGPWALLAGILAGLSWCVALSPVASGALVLGLTALTILTRRFGIRRSCWYLFLASLSVRQPLAFDVLGTTTLYASDLLLYLVFVVTLVECGVGRARGSRTLSIGFGILALSVLGLYNASSLVQGVAQVQRITGQLMVFYVARQFVATGEEAGRTLGAFMLGLLPAVAYGFYQTTIPVEATNAAQWAGSGLAHDASGRSFFRIFSTFDHSLRLSHALTTGFAISIGLLSLRKPPLSKPVLVVVAVLIVLCNQYTYSLGGAVASALTLLVALSIGLGRRSVLFIPLFIVLLLVLTPNAVVYKATQMITGESTSSLSRIVTYQRTLLVLLDRPLTGLGWGSIGETVLQDYRIARLESIGVGAENWWLHRGLALGLPGMILYGFVAVLFFRNVLRAPPDGEWPRRALLLGGVAYFTQAMLYPASGFVMGYVLWLLLAIAEGARREGDAR